jgi:hypothetical protein
VEQESPPVPASYDDAAIEGEAFSPIDENGEDAEAMGERFSPVRPDGSDVAEGEEAAAVSESAVELSSESEFRAPDPAENIQRPAIVVHEPFSAVTPHEPTEGPPPEDSIFSRYVSRAAVGLVALLAMLFVIFNRGNQAPPAVAIIPPAVSEPSGPIVPASAPKPSLQSWRVIAYTYARNADAEKKVQAINNRISGIHAEVFPLGSNPTSYLVSLGAHLTRDEATALRRRALAKGMPRDTYIRNFTD